MDMVNFPGEIQFYQIIWKKIFLTIELKVKNVM